MIGKVESKSIDILRKLINFIISIIQSLHERQKLEKLLSDNRYLESGGYDFYCPGRTYLVKKGVPAGFCGMIGLNNRKCLKSSLKVTDCKDKQFHGQILMTTASGYRVFNYKDGTLLKPFKSDDEKAIYKLAVKTFAPFFNCTTQVIKDEYCIEKVIHNSPRKSWKPDEIVKRFYKIGNDYRKYLESLQSTERVGIRIPSTSSKYVQKVMNRLNQKNLNEARVKDVYCHGDLHFGNTLFSDNNYYLIDFDSYKKEIFYYDLFNIIFVDFVDRNCPLLVALYKSEDVEMMNLFSMLFTAVGDKFDIQQKTQYFINFLVSRLYYDVKDADKMYKGRELRYFLKLRAGKVNSMLDYICN